MNGIDLQKFGITYEKMQGIKVIIALDIGHAETAGCWCLASSNNVLPLEMDGNGSTKIVSAVLKKNKADQTWQVRSINAPDLFAFEEVHVKFKDLPSALNKGVLEEGGTEKKEYVLVNFTRTVLENIRRYNEGLKWDSDSVLLFVGVPSSQRWKDQAEEYAKIIRKACDCQVAIMPESRASLFKAVLDIKQDLLESGVIVIDLGSSTLDWTYLYKDLKSSRVESDEDSINLGAGKIEDLMYQNHCGDQGREQAIAQTMREMKRFPFCQDWTEDQLRKEAEKVYNSENQKSDSRKAKDEGKLNLELRSKKENYFGADGAIEEQHVYKTVEGKTETIKINHEFMEGEEHGVIHTSFDLRYRDGIWDGSWYQDCEKIFLEIKERIGNKPYKTVILTGGASRMSFVQQLAKKVFSDRASIQDRVRILVDQNPSTCVARGMAYAGRMDLEANLKFPDVVKEVRYKMASQGVVNGIAQEAAVLLSEKVYKQAMWPAFVEWRGLSGDHCPKEIGDRARRKLDCIQREYWFKDFVKESIAKGVLNRKDDIISAINEAYKSIYRREIPEEYKITLDEKALKNISDGVIGYTFADSMKDYIKQALSYSGLGILDTYEKDMSKDEREKRVDRIKQKNRTSASDFCRIYIVDMMNKLLSKADNMGRLNKCIEDVVQTMIDDLAAYFA